MKYDSKYMLCHVEAGHQFGKCIYISQESKEIYKQSNKKRRILRDVVMKEN